MRWMGTELSPLAAVICPLAGPSGCCWYSNLPTATLVRAQGFRKEQPAETAAKTKVRATEEMQCEGRC